MDKKELNNQIAEIMAQNAVDKDKVKLNNKSKLVREINYYENELRSNNVELTFESPLTEMEPHNAQAPVGVHGHTREQYMMRWEKCEDELFHFTLENILAHKKKIIIECPDAIIEDIQKLIPLFIEMIAAEAEKMLKEEKED